MIFWFKSRQDIIASVIDFWCSLILCLFLTTRLSTNWGLINQYSLGEYAHVMTYCCDSDICSKIRFKILIVAEQQYFKFLLKFSIVPDILGPILKVVFLCRILYENHQIDICIGSSNCGESAECNFLNKTLGGFPQETQPSRNELNNCRVRV